MTLSPQPLRILIVDDHRQVHEIISQIVAQTADISIVGRAANGLEAIHLCEEVRPDIILMDVVMPIMGGLEATRAINKRFPEIKILALSSYQDHESVYALLKNGAVGYITKSTLTSDLVNILRTAAKGTSVVSPDILEKLVSPDQDQNFFKFNLTDRELEVLVLLADGLLHQQIAEKLSISLSTLKYHTNNIYQKLGVQTRSEALVVAVKNNLI